MKQRISGRQNKAYDGSCCINPLERIRIGVTWEINKLQSTGNASGDVLVENNRVKYKKRPSIKCYLHVSEELVTRRSAYFIWAEKAVHYQCEGQVYGSSKSDVVDVPEKCYVVMIVLVLCRGIVVQMLGDPFLPFWGVYCYVLGLGLSETS